MTDVTRRDFGTLAGASALGVAAPTAAVAQSTTGTPAPAPAFPNGFVWGVATAAYQIEGSPDADGKGKSIWDVYAHMAGKMANGDTGDVANDHYRRYKDDVKLMKDMGVKAYRFSISWPRVFPDGAGEPNPKGLDFYSRLVDELLAAGIEPFATLYHWDLPQALQDKYGGWQSRETSKAFGVYAGHVAKHLSDRVRNFFTINEFHSFVALGYRGAKFTVQGKPVIIEHAPGLHVDNATLNQISHHAVLAHGLAVQAIRAEGKSGTRVGPAEVMNTVVPAIATPDNIKASEIATRDQNAAFLGVMLEGKYSDRFLNWAGKDAPVFTDDDLKAISSPLDFIGINVYRPHMYVTASDKAPGYHEVPMSVTHPRMASSWHLLGPEVLYWAPRHLTSLWGRRDIYITENGCAGADDIAPDGNIYDSDRIMYLRNGLTHLQRATAEGIPVKGNFVWSLMDNLEWTDGFNTRFGLVHVDFKTQKRTLKTSAAYYRAVAEANAVM